MADEISRWTQWSTKEDKWVWKENQKKINNSTATALIQLLDTWLEAAEKN